MLKPCDALLSAVTMDSITCAKQKIREIISGSRVPEDPGHAKNTLAWLLKLDPRADQSLQIAALAHDIDRAVEAQKVRRKDFSDYEAFKTAHAINSRIILHNILNECGVEQDIVDEACRLVVHHESGGDFRSDLLKDADGISFFEVNLPLYFQREGPDETRRRCVWGYQRLSSRMKKVAQNMTYEDEELTVLLKEAIKEACRKD
jgi:hypothetical protein